MAKNTLPKEVKQNAENPEPVEIIAQSIIEVAEAFKVLQKSKLAERTILLLLNDATGIPMRDIKIILYHAPRLATTYLKPPAKP